MQKKLSGINTTFFSLVWKESSVVPVGCGMFIFLLLQECGPFVDIHAKSIIQAAFLSTLVQRSLK
jgi:hypothetical protein